MNIAVNDQLSIGDSEIGFTASRSGGPGGQNVNKVSSRVTLLFDVKNSPSLSHDQKQRIMRKLAGRINKDGVLRVISQRTRSQDVNREDAAARFMQLLREALKVTPRRIPSPTPSAAREKRLTEKRKRTIIKEQRSKKSWDAGF